VPHGKHRDNIRIEAVTGNIAAVPKINGPLAKLIRHLINRTTDAWLLTQHPHALTHGRHRPFSSVNGLGGIYAKAKPSVISGKPIPVQPLEILGPQVLIKLGVYPRQSLQTAEYNAGRTTQVPTGIIVNAGKQRISRKIGFNGKFLQYERT
jgi:hypothetical protein